jgi:hypothetical protein
LGFETLRATYNQATYSDAISPASLLPGRLLARDPIEQAESQQAFPYNFVNDQPISQWDFLGLESASGGSRVRSPWEHYSQITFVVTCPQHTKIYFDDVDYSADVSALIAAGYPNAPTVAGTDPLASGLGGLVDPQHNGGVNNPSGENCDGHPTTIKVWMRSRYAGTGPFLLAGASQKGADAYAGTVIHYHCDSCCGPHIIK